MTPMARSEVYARYLQDLEGHDLVGLLQYGDEQACVDEPRLCRAPLGGDLLIDDHQEGGPATGDGLDAGPDHDLAGADRLVGGDAVGEVGPHGGPEIPL